MTEKIIWYCHTCQRKRAEERNLPMPILLGIEWGGCGREIDGKICGKTKIEVKAE